MSKHRLNFELQLKPKTNSINFEVQHGTNSKNQIRPYWGDYCRSHHWTGGVESTKKSGSDELVIGISPSFAKPLQVAVNEAKQQGLNVKLVEFSDWNTPNITLNHGDIDANFFSINPF